MLPGNDVSWIVRLPVSASKKLIKSKLKKKEHIKNRNILKVQNIENEIVELGSQNIFKKQGIQNKRQLSLRVQQSNDEGKSVSDNIPSWGHAACSMSQGSSLLFSPLSSHSSSQRLCTFYTIWRYSWSGCSLWCSCRMQWGWVGAGGLSSFTGSAEAAVPSWLLAAVFTDQVRLSVMCKAQVKSGGDGILSGAIWQSAFHPAGEQFSQQESCSVPQTSQRSYLVHIIVTCRRGNP